MRRHKWSGAAVVAALALAAISCGGDTSASAPVETSHQPATTTGQIALSRKADTITVDQSLQLTAIVPSIPGSVAPVISWASSDTNVAIVTKHGVLFALKSGRTTVTATRSGYTDAAVVTVNPGIRDIAFDSDSLAISLGHSIRIPYRVRDTDGNAVDLTRRRVEWISSSPDVAPLTGDATITGRSIGRTAVVLRVDNKIGTTGVRVLNKPVASVFVSPSSVTLAAGQSTQLTSTTYDVNGNPIAGRNVSWSSSNSDVATVDDKGLLTTVSEGTAEIRVNAEGRKISVPVTVTAASSNSGAAVASVSVTLNAPSLATGQSTQATATLRDGSGAELNGRSIVWTSSDPHVATISGSGFVSATQPGTVTITATSEGKSGSASLGVAPGTGTSAPVESVALSVPSSINVGQTAQASVTLKDGSGNVLSGRPVAFVSSDDNIATVSSNGVVSALRGGAVTISASSEGKSASAVVTSVAPKPAVHMITLTSNASTLNVGELTQVTAIPKDVNGTPISGLSIAWSSSPSAVATVSSSGMASARSAGTVQIYAKVDAVSSNIGITVLDTLPTPVSGTYPGGNGTLGSIANMAELPRASVSTSYPSPARQVRVPAGANLQSAIDGAQPGDELLLAPGAAYVGNFILPNKGSSTSWITIRTDVSDAAIGSQGTRMTPTRAASANLAKILTPNNESAIATALSAHHYRLTGIEVSGTNSASEINGLVQFGDGSGAQNSMSLVAHDLVLDRAYVHGQTTQAVRRCVSLQGATSAVVDSWISECHSNNGDSQGIVGWNGPGPFLIKNNRIEGGHMGVFFGGADPAIANLSPSDISVIGNHITRPASWKGVWQTKTIIETKNARRMLLEGNLIENVWADAQVGFAILLKSENQNGSAPWSQTTDLTMRYNRVRNIGSAINIAANGGWAQVVPAARISIHDNVFETLGTGIYAGGGIPLQILGGTYDVLVAHNSFSNAGIKAVSFDGGPSTRTVIHSNVLPNGEYGVHGSGTAVGMNSISNYMPGGVFSYDVIPGADCNLYPATTICPSSMPSSLGNGYDGRTIGADMSKVNSATSTAVVSP